MQQGLPLKTCCSHCTQCPRKAPFATQTRKTSIFLRISSAMCLAGSSQIFAFGNALGFLRIRTWRVSQHGLHGIIVQASGAPTSQLAPPTLNVECKTGTRLLLDLQSQRTCGCLSRCPMIPKEQELVPVVDIRVDAVKGVGHTRGFRHEGRLDLPFNFLDYCCRARADSLAKQRSSKTLQTRCHGCRGRQGWLRNHPDGRVGLVKCRMHSERCKRLTLRSML